MLIDNFIQFIKNDSTNFTPKTILDVGSRDLKQSIEFSSVYPEAKIHAFEPNPEQYNICKTASENYENINVYQYAVSDVESKLNFYVTHGNVGASSLLKPIHVPFGTSQDYSCISVDCIRLDKWFTNNNIETVDILWMDTQGIELLALKGMGNFLRTVKYIHCEAATSAYYEGHILKNDLDQFLIDSGFDISFIPVSHPFGEGDVIAKNKNL